LRWTDIEIRKYRMPDSPTKIDDESPIGEDDDLPPPLEKPEDDDLDQIDTAPERKLQSETMPAVSEMNFEELD
jgi:hypothetical protein